MNIKALELQGLTLVDSNADYSEAQTIFIDFDGAENVSYNNDALSIHIGGLSIADSGLSQEERSQILTELNNTFAGTGITFTLTVPVNEEYSTIYVGGNGSAFAGYGSFQGLAETIDVGNRIKNDEAFVFSDSISNTATITETIAHEAGHLLGFSHENNETIASDINDFAWEDYMATYKGGNYKVNWHSETLPGKGTYSFEVDNTPYSKTITTWYVNNVEKEKDTTYTSAPDPSYYFSSSAKIEAPICDGNGNWLESHIWNVSLDTTGSLELWREPVPAGMSRLPGTLMAITAKISI